MVTHSFLPLQCDFEAPPMRRWSLSPCPWNLGWSRGLSHQENSVEGMDGVPLSAEASGGPTCLFLLSEPCHCHVYNPG